ncbi:YbjN domain-containing protein [Crenobacter intestini]|uniref:YbjN domain-containing protein n=1 Tax=Crenobacter intestini TaxID=2563443 RepID=A0A4T0UP55_9NEIS|nr:YbjN domain-containing protein [Crenobacter intestini]TIC80316.1 hypothetical protein E5K04_12485 [Crenobacter intestini]
MSRTYQPVSLEALADVEDIGHLQVIAPPTLSAGDAVWLDRLSEDELQLVTVHAGEPIPAGATVYLAGECDEEEVQLSRGGSTDSPCFGLRRVPQRTGDETGVPARDWSALPLGTVARDFCDERFDGRCELSGEAEAGITVFTTGYTIQGQAHYKLFIEAEERRCWLALFLYTPLFVPEARRDELCRLLMHINDQWRVPGALLLRNGGQICYRQIVDFEGCEVTPRALHNMLQIAGDVHATWFDAYARVALAGQSLEDVLASRQQAQD